MGEQQQEQGQIAEAISGGRYVLKLPNGDPVLIDPAALAARMQLEHSPYVPFLRELILHPSEIWLTFERHRGTGQVRMRMYAVAMLDGGIGLVLVMQASDGIMEAWTLMATDHLGLQNYRVGRLLWTRDKAVSDN
jgi:phage-Barnase-EndoU-ColicinE5/D-RelE like nuclease2